MKDIRVGDAVVAIKDGGYDREGFPVQIPIAGNVYRITSIYEMRYGLGCTLQGMNPEPYRGYFLFVKRGGRTIQPGWYFEKLAGADPAWSKALYDLLRSKETIK